MSLHLLSTTGSIRRSPLNRLPASIVTVGLLALLASSGLALRSSSAAAACAGDCDGDGAVTVNEILQGVNIALGIALPTLCPSIDTSGDGMVTVDELLAAVNNVLSGCPATPTPSATATATVTPTPHPNHAPTLVVPEVYRTYPGYPVQLALNASDPDGDQLEFSAASLPDGATIDTATGVLSWTPTEAQAGAFDLTVMVTDNGVPPLTAQTTVAIKVSPTDACVQASCDPAAGCQTSLAAVTSNCCTGPPAVRIAEPTADCPQAGVLFIGRNVLSGFGRLQDCDQFRIQNFGQIGAVARFNIEAKCVRTDLPATVSARLETGRRLLFDTSFPANLSLQDNGYAQRLGMQFPLESPGPYFDLDGAEANFTVTLVDGEGTTLSTSLRVILGFAILNDLPDLD